MKKLTLYERFKYWQYRRKNALPSPKEIYDLGAWDACVQHLVSSEHKRNQRYIEVAGFYALGYSMEELVALFQISSERVRLCIWKYYAKASVPFSLKNSFKNLLNFCFSLENKNKTQELT